MRSKVIATCGLGLLMLAGDTLASPFYAPPVPKEDSPPLTGEAELGFTHLQGNTNSQTLIAKGRLVWLDGAFTHSLRGEARHVTQDEETSAEQYLLAARERYDIEGPHYLFGFARWEDDRFSGYDYQATVIGGYGRQVLDNERHVLSLEAGPGYRVDSVTDEPTRRLGVAYGAMDYRWHLSDTASFAQELSLEGTDRNLTARSLSSLTSRLNEHLALKLSYELKHNTRPPDGATARTDRITNVSLLYDW
ncbi:MULTISPECIES: DUF481 domain-containing protein [Halomonas]|uniref:Outer membrane protein n=1 Tax=Halomonas halophila TaxID=29573 RepID=A0ABQ0U4S5_9GAMM|nr:MULTISPECIES: DUF481 domain-containing protein [Halomonas]MDR5890053.1 DUF481 domain-containing protein [Halomonas salina]RAH39259.1 DUF481 domain-containing protein [Halomonas sp. SL1]WJY06843.1 DUF481 domain-containing protein [Halomonas halophila]GEK72733.1 outer membrane protein [Halomonas halophila]